MFAGEYTTLDITTQLWRKNEDYISYYYWVSYNEGKVSTVSKFRKEMFEGELRIFREKIDKRKTFILEKELEGYEEVTGVKKEQFTADAFSPIKNIMYYPKGSKLNNIIFSNIK